MKSTLLLANGRNEVLPARSSAVDTSQEPALASVPRVSVTPVGTPVMRVVAPQLSDPSASGVAKVGRSAISVSSRPAALPPMVPASATGSTPTLKLADVRAGAAPSAASRATAVRVRFMAPEKCAGGVMLTVASWARVRVQLPSVLWVPADSVAVAGTPVRVKLSVSDPSVSPSAPPRPARRIALSSAPVTSATSTVGASATA